MFEGKNEKLIKKEIEICLNCPLANCNGSQHCSYLVNEKRKYRETLKNDKNKNNGR